MNYVGLDIGGTNVRFAFTNELGAKTLDCQKQPYIVTGIPYTEVERNICNIIDAFHVDVAGISISLAAVMDRSTGRVKIWPNNPCWNHYELVQHLKNKYRIPVVIEDDANCGAIGEYYSLHTSFKNMAYITIGTGIGCGLILNGSLFLGESGFAGELGHVHIGNENDEILCSCGNNNCFQAITSGPAILKKYNTIVNTNLASLEQVNSRYLQNDPIAVQCLSDVIDNISKIIYNLVMCLDISVFIIGGGVSNLGIEFISRIEKQTNVRLSHFEREISVKQARLGDFSGVYGALQLLKDCVHNEKG